MIFSPSGERSDQFVGHPESRLKNLVLTPEDFADIRNIQPFVMTTEQLWNYDAEFKGEELMADLTCWVLRLRPGHILSGQRLFGGLIRVKQDDYSVVRLQRIGLNSVIMFEK